MRLLDLSWDEWNQEHIARHGVEPNEVEEVVASGRYYLARVRAGRYGVIGQTDAGRYLSIVLERESSRTFFVVTARDADPAERRLFNRHAGRRR